MNNIYLVGFMGTGKSTIARRLQKFLPFQIVEMDEAIERVEAMTIPEIFEKKGEEGFRKAESQLLAIIAKEKNQIISCGGGIVLRKENTMIHMIKPSQAEGFIFAPHFCLNALDAVGHDDAN